MNGQRLRQNPSRFNQSMNRSKAELKKLVPEDAKEASGHGIKAKRSKSGAISFDALVLEGSDASVQ
jgi:hypothetical protein